MLYFKCPTCKTLLANKQIPYEKAIREISSNSNLTDKQKDEQREALLNKLKLTNLCCRMRIMTFVNLLEIIKNNKRVEW
jgi:DNA-directed RNA polymerase subunit N (RpoN/RPB10)